MRSINEDGQDLRRLAVERRNPAMRSVTSTGSLTLRRRRSGDDGVKSCWEVEATTPMTSRPHFSSLRSISPRYRHSRTGKPRAISLGSAAEGERLIDPATFSGYSSVSPLLKFHTRQEPMEAVTSEVSQILRFPERTYSQLIIEKNEQVHVLTAIDDDFGGVSKYNTIAVVSTRLGDFGINVLYGLINASIVLPVLLSFASIIYQDAFFSPYMPVLVKLTLTSGIIHQVCFSTFSSLPFAVGQVQDAGLIFLHSMASYIVAYCRQNVPDCDDETLLATVTVLLSLCTATLGCGLILVGRWKLAQYVQMLPTAVMGGYLAFIGYFCGLAGLKLMAGSPSELTIRIFFDRWIFLLPGIFGGLFIYFSVWRLRHMAVLPTCIILLLCAFYTALSVSGITVEEATEMGWIRAMEPPPPWYNTWNYFRFDKVVWSVFPRLIPTLLGMIFVVALSSSLDVAAIELELKCPLDYNKELRTVGISNLVSGLTGGYTGSYIFSQTIFSLRAGIRSRIAGFALAAFQAIVLVLPFPILSYIPNFFFGSLLIMICVDLIIEWLWKVRNRVRPTEYYICLLTFACCLLMAVETGICCGVVVFIACKKLGMDVGESQRDAEGHGDKQIVKDDVKVNKDEGGIII